MSRTGDRCTLFDKIDGLDEARTVADLVKRLKPILNELAFFMIAGDAATQTENEWHDEFSAALGHEHITENDPPPAPTARQESAPRRSRPAKSSAASEGKYAPRGPSSASRAAALPPSLRAIMEGTHESLKDDN